MTLAFTPPGDPRRLMRLSNAAFSHVMNPAMRCFRLLTSLFASFDG